MTPAERRRYDAHVHLQAYPPGLLHRALRRARAAGILKFGCCATSPDDWLRIREIAHSEEGVEPNFGVHPWFSAKQSDLAFIADLENLLGECPEAGIGEIGLDGTRSDHDVQKCVFSAQMEVACRMARRVSIHCVRADTTLLAVLKEHAHKLPRILVHAPSISIETWHQLEKLGVDVSIGPRVLSPRARKMRELAATVPQERLYFETDSPYTSVDKCAVPALNGLNAPESLPLIIAEVARLRSASYNQPNTGDE